MHVPAGAVPKDGPSAGVAMTMAMASLFSGRPMRPDLGMTGEVTLRGRVLPVGGVKMKMLAAHRAGLKQVILPKRNEGDLEEVPEDVRDAMSFVLVERIDEALAAALQPEAETAPQARGAPEAEVGSRDPPVALLRGGTGVRPSVPSFLARGRR